MDNEYQNRILISVIAVIILTFIFIMPASQKDIAGCVDKTGWSTTKCKMELSR